MSTSQVKADNLSDMPWITVKIQKTRTDNSGFSIIGHLEEHFTYGMAAEYQAPYSSTLQSLANSAPLFSFITKTTPIVSPWLTTQYWQGTEVQDMQITLVLEAKSDPLTEVRQPILDLLSLVAPTYDANTTLLRSPIENSFLDQALVKEFSQKIGESISELASSSGAAAELAGALAKAKEGNIGELKDKLGELANKAFSGVANGMSTLTNAVSSIGQPIMGQISQAGEALNSAVGSAKQEAEKLVDSATQFVGGSTGNAATGGAVSGAAASGGNAATGGSAVVSNSSNNGSPNASAASSTASKPVSPTAILMQKMKTPTVSIQIGNYMLFPCVVVTNVTTNILNQIDAYTGWPLSAEVQISFRPMFTQAYGDVVALFLDKKSPAYNADKAASDLSPTDTLVSSLTSAITSPIKDVGKKITGSVSNVANSAAQKVAGAASSAAFSAGKALGKILPW